MWIIDPLDGTTNFIHGFPVYCVSIALAVRGKVEQAVIYDPSRNDLFTATKGRGAYMNERRIRVSKRIDLRQCLISTGFPFRPGDNFNNYLRMMAEVMQRTAGLRRPGAAALDLAYVAAGFTDGFFETGLSPWDVAAGSLLVTEAGGLIGNFTGESDFLEQKECVAGNPKIYGQLVAHPGQVQQVRQRRRKGRAAPDDPQSGRPDSAPSAQLPGERRRVCLTAQAGAQCTMRELLQEDPWTATALVALLRPIVGALMAHRVGRALVLRATRGSHGAEAVWAPPSTRGRRRARWSALQLVWQAPPTTCS